MSDLKETIRTAMMGAIITGPEFIDSSAITDRIMQAIAAAGFVVLPTERMSPDHMYAVPTGLETPIWDYSPLALAHMTREQLLRLPVHVGAGRRFRLEVWMRDHCTACNDEGPKRCFLCTPFYTAIE